MSRSVLIVDDDDALAENVAEIVSLLGVETTVAPPSGFTRPSALGVDEQRVNVVIALTAVHPGDRVKDGARVEAR